MVSSSTGQAAAFSRCLHPGVVFRVSTSGWPRSRKRHPRKSRTGEGGDPRQAPGFQGSARGRRWARTEPEIREKTGPRPPQATPPRHHLHLQVRSHRAEDPGPPPPYPKPPRGLAHGGGWPGAPRGRPGVVQSPAPKSSRKGHGDEGAEGGFPGSGLPVPSPGIASRVRFIRPEGELARKGVQATSTGRTVEGLPFKRHQKRRNGQQPRDWAR